MKKEDIHIWDLERILLGDVPLEFYIELAIRALFVYLIITFGMRLMGKRISSDLTRSELAAVATMAAATGLIILAPDRGMLPPLVVLFVLIVIKWAVHKLTYRFPKTEDTTEGSMSTLVTDGVMQLQEMKKTRISAEQLFSQLRGGGIRQLGAVRRLYMEANGSFTVIKNEEPVPGLAVIPAWDSELLARFRKVEEAQVCKICGTPVILPGGACKTCGSTAFTPAVLEE